MPDTLYTGVGAGAQPRLLDHHRRMLVEGSGIDPEVVAERGAFSVEEPVELVEHALLPAPTPGLVLPVRWPGREEAILVYRPDAPADPKRKYLWPRGVPTRLDSPPRCHDRLKDPGIPLWVTEGIKKADALASQGLCAVALGGVDCFGALRGLGLAVLGDGLRAGRPARPPAGGPRPAPVPTPPAPAWPVGSVRPRLGGRVARQPEGP